MAPPPATPSPHRFLINKKSNKSSTPTPSKLSQQVPQDAPQTSTPRPASGPTPTQFTRGPRFAALAGRRASFPPRSPSPAKPHFAAPGTPTRQSNQVQDAVTVDDDDEMLDNGNVELAPVTRAVSEESLPEPEKAPVPTSHLPSSPKRRRIEAEDVTSTPQPTPGRFILPSSTDASRAFSNTGGGTPSRRAFLMASIPPPEQAEPLPDAFSPRRRGQRFVPGGLAAEVQSWVIEMAQSASHSRRGKGHTKNEDLVHTVKVTEAEGDGPMFVQGQMTGGRQAKAILVEGQASQKTEKVRAGDVVGIRQPTWDVQVSGETWMVGVDWRTMKN